jgi:uncharacterized protein YegJ (DUF2314 family)
MKRPRHLIALFFAVLALALPVAGCKKAGRDMTITVSSDDPEMMAAIAKARETLPEFWKAFQHPDSRESGFALKVKITDAHGTEHFWATGIKRKGGIISGQIENVPGLVTSVTQGEEVTIAEAEISDWRYLLDGKLKGAYTVRALLPKMSPRDRKFHEGILAEP